MIGFVGGEKGDRCLILKFRRSDFAGVEGRSPFDVGEIGDRVCGCCGAIAV